MHYIKIKVIYELIPEVYRTFWVNEEVSLEELGACVIAAFNAKFTHEFKYVQGRKTYVPYFGVEFPFNLNLNVDTFFGHRLIDLLKNNESFSLIYDVKEQNTFKFFVLDDEMEIEFEEEKARKVLLIDGYGYGMFEDNLYLLKQLIDNKDMNKVLKDLNIQYKDLMYHPPLTLEEYFKPLDLDDLHELVHDAYMLFNTFASFRDVTTEGMEIEDKEELDSVNIEIEKDIFVC